MPNISNGSMAKSPQTIAFSQTMSSIFFSLLFISLLTQAGAYQGFATMAIRKGQEPEKCYMDQLVPAISMSTTYIQKKPNTSVGHSYSSSGNPTRDALEETLAALEKAKYCRVFGSGMAAIIAVGNLLEYGDNIICFNHIYSGTRNYLEQGTKRFGLTLDYVDLTHLENLQNILKQRTKTKMVWFESPSNPVLKLVDIKRLVNIVKAINPEVLVVIDNTFMSPFFQNPLEKKLGVDVVVHSATKYINGHNDVMMGAVMTNSEVIDKHLKSQQIDLGSVPSAFDCYLANRGVKTLPMRMKQHNANGLAVAKFLEAHPSVEKVVYPMLESHPQHELHKAQSSGMSGMVSVYLKGGVLGAEEFVSRLKLFSLAESLGGVESLIQVPVLMAFSKVPEDVRKDLEITENLLRISVGCEDTEDLIKDLEQALAINQQGKTTMNIRKKKNRNKSKTTMGM